MASNVFVLDYLLKTGPISLRDLVTRMSSMPELATRLAELTSSGEIELEGDRDAIRRLNLVLRTTEEEAAAQPDVVLARLQTNLNEIPGAKQVRVRLSESAFRRALKR